MGRHRRRNTRPKIRHSLGSPTQIFIHRQTVLSEQDRGGVHQPEDEIESAASKVACFLVSETGVEFVLAWSIDDVSEQSLCSPLGEKNRRGIFK